MRAGLIVGGVIVLGLGIGAYFFLHHGTQAAGNAAVAAKPWIEVDADPVYLGTEGNQRPLHSGDEVLDGGTISTGATGAAIIHFPDESVARLDKNTTLTVSSSYDASSGWLIVQIGLSAGRVWSKVVALATPQSSWQVKTSNVVATVRGTAFGVGYSGGISSVIGSQHTVGVAPLDPNTHQPVYAAETLVGEGKFIQVSDSQAATAAQSGTSTVLTKVVTSVPTSYQNDPWVKSDIQEDQTFDTHMNDLQSQTNNDATQVRQTLQEENVAQQQTTVQTAVTNTTSPQPQTAPTTSTGASNTNANSQTSSGSSGGGSVTTSAKTVISIKISANKATDALTEGDTVQFTATATYSDGTTADVTNSVSWLAIGPMGDISTSGLFTAKLDASVSELGSASGSVIAILQTAKKTSQSVTMHVKGAVDTNVETGG